MATIQQDIKSVETTKQQPKRIPPRRLEVVERITHNPYLSSLMLRSADGADLSDCWPGCHIKLFFPLAHQDKPELPTLGPAGPVWPPKDQKPIVRTYSIKKYHPHSKLIEIGYANHDKPGYATDWMNSCKPGAQLALAGPGGPKPIMPASEWHLLVGDVSTLPTSQSILANLPADAIGKGIFHVPSAEAKVDFVKPAGIDITWVCGTAPADQQSFVRTVTSLKIPDAKALSAYVAGESHAVVAIKKHLKQHYQPRLANLYAIPYWKNGETEEAYHEERHRIMDSE